MRKRITAFVCFMMMAVSFVPSVVTAENTSDTKQIKEELNALGIATPISVRVKTDEFVTSLAGFFYDKEDIPKDVGAVARQTGMIEQDENYKGSETMYMHTALKFAVTALGYKKTAEGRGGEIEDYINIASELKITEGVSFSENSVLASGDAIRILYNMLDTEPMLSYYATATDMGYRLAEGETLLSVNRNVTTIKGIVTANEDTALTKSDGVGEGYIEINEKLYQNAYENAGSYIGMKVQAYIKSDKKDGDTVLYVNDYRNNILTLDAESIEDVSDDYTSMAYLTTDETKIKNARLKIALNVIVNGKMYGDYKKADLIPDVGEVMLIDYDGDDTYDVVKVTSYETMIVDTVSVGSGRIESKYTYSGALTFLDLETESEEVKYEIYKDGEQVTISAIKPGDVLSVARSKNSGDKLVKIYVSTEKLTASLSGINQTEKEIKLNGKIYKITDEFINYSKESAADVLSIGSEYLFSFDYFKNAVYYKKTVESEYYLFHKVYMDEADDDRIYVTYMDMNSEWYTSELAKSPKYNQEKGTKLAIYELIKNEPSQIIRLQRNTDGEIKSIEFAEENTGYDEKKFTKTPKKKLRYRSTPKFFQNISALDEIVHLNDGAMVVAMPANTADIKTDVGIYDTASYFVSDMDYEITAYDMDEYGFTNLLMITENDAIKNNGVNYSLYVVSDISTVVNDEDEAVRVVTGNMGDFRNISFTIRNDSILPDVTVGDVLNVHLNKKLEIDYGVKVYSLNAPFVPNVPGSGVYTKSAMAAGLIRKVDIEGGKINILCDSTSYSFSLRNTPAVQIYNTRTKTCEIGSLADLRRNNNAVCRVSWGQLHEIIMIEKE